MVNVRMNNDETMVALFFIIFPAILFIVIAAIPVRTFTRNPIPTAPNISPYKRIWALILSAGMFIFVCGLQRFYVGKIATGLLWLCTGGLFGIGQVYDIIMIFLGRFTDKYGRRVIIWETSAELETHPMETNIANKPADLTEAEPEHTAPAASPSETLSDFDSRMQPVAQPFSQFSLHGMTSSLLSFFARLVILIAVLVGLAVAIDLPEMIAAGLFDPGLARELQDDVFGGYANWPQLALRIGRSVMILMMMIAAIILIIARRRTSSVHMTRAVLGVAGMFTAVEVLCVALKPINWHVITGMVNSKQLGPAIEMGFSTARADLVVVAAIITIAAIFIMAWPAKKPDNPSTIGQQGV